MLKKFLKDLFGNEKEARNVVVEKMDQKIKQTETVSTPVISPVEQFLSSLESVGHPEYPILDKRYSPNSRVPCTDLIPFISNRILEDDILSIKLIMRSVIEANPGLGIESSWIDKKIDEVLSIPFEQYVTFPSTSSYSVLKAFFVVAEKAGGSRPFLLTDEIPRLISWGCIVYQPKWSYGIQLLVKRANLWIDKMATEFPETLWQEYPRFNVAEYPNSYLNDMLGEKILSLTPAARLQLFYAVEKGGGSLNSFTNALASGPIRSFGINIAETSKELMESELVKPSSSILAIEQSYSKQELIDFCESNNIKYQKSWKKKKLLYAISEYNEKLLDSLAEVKNVVAPNFEKFTELKNIVNIADEHLVCFKLLCFA